MTRSASNPAAGFTELVQGVSDDGAVGERDGACHADGVVGREFSDGLVFAGVRDAEIGDVLSEVLDDLMPAVDGCQDEVLGVCGDQFGRVVEDGVEVGEELGGAQALGVQLGEGGAPLSVGAGGACGQGFGRGGEVGLEQVQ